MAKRPCGQPVMLRTRRISAEEEPVGYALTFSPDGSLLACASDSSGHIFVLRTSNARQQHVFDAKGVWNMAFSPQGDLLATVSGREGVNVWHVATGNHIAHFFWWHLRKRWEDLKLNTLRVSFDLSGQRLI